MKRRIHNILVDFLSQIKYSAIMIEEERDNRWQWILYRKSYFETLVHFMKIFKAQSLQHLLVVFKKHSNIAFNPIMNYKQ